MKFCNNVLIRHTIKKFSNTNKNIDGKNSSINYSDIYRCNISSLFSSVFADEIFSLVNTNRIIVGNKEEK
jgi:hypothetical protein